MSSNGDDAARRLRDDERQRTFDALRMRDVAPEAICRRAVEEARLIPRWPRLAEIRGPRSVIAHVALASRADGIALGRNVYIRAALFGEDGALPLDLVAHEVTHVAQVLRDSTAGFYARYVAEYLRGRYRGLGDHGAYLAISYEVEAREVGACVGPPLRSSGRPVE